jgi:hypothetical protein
MFIVNIQDVQISNIPDVTNPHQSALILSYLSRQYTLVQVFPLSQWTPAQRLWRHFDEQGKVSLIVFDNQQYLIWVEKIDSPDLRLEPVFRAQLCLIDGLWAEIRELLGRSQASEFVTEILNSIPSMKSIKGLLATIALATQPDRSIETYILSNKQLFILHQEIYRLGRKYLGKNYLQEIIGDLEQGLQPQLRRELQAWLNKQSRSTS